MRFLVGAIECVQSVFVVNGSTATDLTSAIPEIGRDLSALVGYPDLQARVTGMLGKGRTVDASDITPALPVTTPGKFICLGLNYVEHIKEGGYDIPDYPAIFMRGRNSLTAAGSPMLRPACSERLDYEAELLVIIGKGGRHIPQADALDHVFGYTVFNDGSVRDYQRKTHQWTPGKNFDSTGAVGPVVVTPDELPEGARGLKIETRIGDEVLQSSNTANMIWSVARTISIISEYSTLEPGDHVAMGTPPGVGHARKPNPRWLRPGETVDVEIESICICSSPVVDEIALPETVA